MKPYAEVSCPKCGESFIPRRKKGGGGAGYAKPGMPLTEGMLSVLKALSASGAISEISGRTAEELEAGSKRVGSASPRLSELLGAGLASRGKARNRAGFCWWLTTEGLNRLAEEAPSFAMKQATLGGRP